TYPADFHGPGDVGSHGAGKVRFMCADGKRHPLLQRLEAAFAAGGVDAAVDPRVMISIWDKAAFNAAINSICATTGRTVGELGASPEGARVGSRGRGGSGRSRACGRHRRRYPSHS